MILNKSILTVLFLILFTLQSANTEKHEKFVEPEFSINELYKQLKDRNVKYPDIVLSQAILETGWFSSKLFIENNNLFGIYNSKEKRFQNYNHWTLSIESYKNRVQYKYKEGECYYSFLERIGYAKDPMYVNKLKQIKKKWQSKD